MAGTAPPVLVGFKAVIAEPTVKTLVVGVYLMFGACARAHSVNKKNSESSPINNIALFNTAEFKLTTSEVKKTSAMFYPLSS